MASTETPPPGGPAATAAEAPAPADSEVAEDLALRTSPEITANTFPEYIRTWAKRARHGESGMLPVIAGLIVIVIIFQSQNSHFLTAGNITNLIVQGATFVLLGMAEVFVLLLGEVDLSMGYIAGVGAIFTVNLSQPHHTNWFLALLAGLAIGSFFGAIQGALITRFKLPSFVVTLAGLLGFEGILIYLADREGGRNGGGTIRVSNNIINDLVNGNLSVAAGWIVLVIAVVLFGLFVLGRDRRRKASGLVAPPLMVTLLKVAVVAAAGVILVIVCNSNRGRLVPLRGVPWVVLIVLGTLAVWTVLLGRTRFGRYLYAIGGNAEAARRAGIGLSRVRLLAFTLGGMTAALAGIIYASRLGSISNNVDGGQLVLYAIAAAVIGGTSLFGGRGKMVHAVVGGLVIATIYNGMGLIGLSAAFQFMVTALVLLAAVTLDALARRSTRA